MIHLTLKQLKYRRRKKKLAKLRADPKRACRMNLGFHHRISEIPLFLRDQITAKFDCQYNIHDQGIYIYCKEEDANKILKKFRNFKKYKMKRR